MVMHDDEDSRGRLEECRCMLVSEADCREARLMWIPMIFLVIGAPVRL